MNVASLELCQELYELSGWKTDDWYDLDENGEPMPHLATEEDIYGGEPGQYLPAYDLGYLLRKLPPTTAIMHANKRGYEAYIVSLELKLHGQRHFADSPEDAAAKLCIELFKQGVLTR